MKRCLSLCLFAPLVWALTPTPPAAAQIPATDSTIVRSYAADGMTDQPFTVEVLGARRTVNNILYVRLALTNRGTGPIQPHQDFAGDTNPTDNDRISALIVVDPNGQKKYPVLRNAQNQPLCSRVAPPIKPGERRVVGAQFAAPPDTDSSVDVYFPKATPILGVPIGLPEAGEPLTDDGAAIIQPSVAVPPGSVPIAPAATAENPTSNNEPNVYTNETNPTVPGKPDKGIGSVESANSTVPFTIDVLGVSAGGGGRHAVLRMAITNNGSGELIATGQFNGDVAEPNEDALISGVYLVDPVGKSRYTVLRENGTTTLCSKIDPPLSPGERRVLEAQFPPIPATVKSVYVYFPHATPIASIPVTP